MPTSQETMIGVLRQVREFDRKGKLSSDTNPQLVLAVRESKKVTGTFSAKRALRIFNGEVVDNSITVAQAQPGVMLRAASII